MAGIDAHGLLRWTTSVLAIGAFAALARAHLLTGSEATASILAVLAGNLYPRPPAPPAPPPAVPA